MAAFFVNYQVKLSDPAAVAVAAAELVRSTAFVSPPVNGWVTLFDQTSEAQDAYEIGRLGSDLSAQLSTVVLVFVVNDSNLLVYYLFDHGDLLDEYNSSPTPLAEGADPDQKSRFDGRPEIILQYCVPGTDRSVIESALLKADTLVEGGFASGMFAEERLHPLAAALGMDDARVTMGFNDFQQQMARLPDAGKYLKVDSRRTRRAGRGMIPPKMPPR